MSQEEAEGPGKSEDEAEVIYRRIKKAVDQEVTSLQSTYKGGQDNLIVEAMKKCASYVEQALGPKCSVVLSPSTVSRKLPEQASHRTGGNEENSRRGSKIDIKPLELLGDPATLAENEKLVKVIGDEMPQEAVARMIKSEKRETLIKEHALERERLDTLNSVMKARHKSNEDTLTHQVDTKALDVMGDEDLERLNMKALPSKAMVDAKNLALLGDASLLGNEKVTKVIGDEMSQEAIAKMARAKREEERMEAERLEREQQEKIKTVLEINVTKELAQQVDEKAIAMMGEQLREKNLKAVPKNSVVDLKVVKMLGEVSVQGGKANKIIGDEMSPEANRKMVSKPSPSLKLSLPVAPTAELKAELKSSPRASHADAGHGVMAKAKEKGMVRLISPVMACCCWCMAIS
ncbi:unnamed protein product [Chrysoparadoxa australica]